jgi:predicted nucleic acid-binding protein
VIVADSTVLIDWLRGDDQAVAWLTGLPSIPRCSELTRTDVIRGLRSAERGRAERLFGVFKWVPVDEPIARRAGDLGREHRRSHHLGTIDLLVAATALELGADVATANVKHFPMFRGLKAPY